MAYVLAAIFSGQGQALIALTTCTINVIMDFFLIPVMEIDAWKKA